MELGSFRAMSEYVYVNSKGIARKIFCGCQNFPQNFDILTREDLA